MASLARALLAGASLVCALTAQATPPPGSVKLDIPQAQLYVNEADEAAMVADINRMRVEGGLKALKLDPALTRVARAYAREMFINGYFGHIDMHGLNPADRMKAAKIPFRKAGENIAFGPNEQTAQAGLVASPEHLLNMMDPAYARIGVGVIADSVYGSTYVQEFAQD